MSRILQTKIFVPRTVSEVIERPLLMTRLEQGRATGRLLTLVAAAAGCGCSVIAFRANALHARSVRRLKHRRWHALALGCALLVSTA